MAIGARNLIDRISDKFLVDDGCWLWTASRFNGGYGQINSGGGRGRPLPAHRVVYEIVNGPISDGLQLDHLCRNRQCVRPDHLEPVTQLENVRRGEAGLIHRERMQEQAQCARGHEFTVENTHIDKNANGNPRRNCRQCRALRERERRARARS